MYMKSQCLLNEDSKLHLAKLINSRGTMLHTGIHYISLFFIKHRLIAYQKSNKVL